MFEERRKKEGATTISLQTGERGRKGMFQIEEGLTLPGDGGGGGGENSLHLILYQWEKGKRKKGGTSGGKKPVRRREKGRGGINSPS